MSADALNRLQEFCQAKLKSEAYFANVNCVLMRKLLTDGEVNVASVYQHQTSAKSGVGVVVNMPVGFVEDSEVPGPYLKIQQSFTVIEERNINNSALGTGKSAEAVAIKILEFLHQLLIQPLGTLYGAGTAIEPNLSFEGLVGVDVNLELKLAQSQAAKITTPIFSIFGPTVTLAPVEVGSAIYYTLDGTFPGPGNPAAVLYTVPFTVTQGQQLLWAGYKANYDGSDVWARTIDFS